MIQDCTAALHRMPLRELSLHHCGMPWIHQGSRPAAPTLQTFQIHEDAFEGKELAQLLHTLCSVPDLTDLEISACSETTGSIAFQEKEEIDALGRILPNLCELSLQFHTSWTVREPLSSILAQSTLLHLDVEGAVCVDAFWPVLAHHRTLRTVRWKQPKNKLDANKEIKRLVTDGPSQLTSFLFRFVHLCVFNLFIAW